MRILSCLLYCMLSVSSVSAQPSELIVKLDYGSFQGWFYTEHNLTSWRKIPFAAPPTGQNRFRAPQPPLPVKWTYDTNQEIPSCPSHARPKDEDCLYLGVHSRPWTPGQPLRPVFLYLFGGGFSTGVPASAPPFYASMNVTNQNDYVAVDTNYRISAFGFMPGKELFDDPNSDLNVGLLDQEAAMKWIQKYIHLFGGDPNQVTIWGASAGGGGVMAHAIARGGKTDPPLFKRGLANSPYWPKTYAYDSPEAEVVFDFMAESSNCSYSADRLACLKAVSAPELARIAGQIEGLYKWGPSTYTWSPVIEPHFLTNTLSDALTNGSFNGEEFLTSYVTWEGQFFLPKSMKHSEWTETGFNFSNAGFESWLKNYLPSVTNETYNRILEVYPIQGSAEVIGDWHNPYERASILYRDLQLACPAYFLASTKKDGYMFQYNIGASSHGDDAVFWMNPHEGQLQYPLLYQGLAGAYSSYVQTGDPNAHKLTNSSIREAPNIHTGLQYSFGSHGIRTGRLVELPERCGFWLSIASEIAL
ncbi:Alpha/Beta hydrolase protein [Xylariales sp. PMI_506]|nr:Alpha/Beta hydrolase protein [Xylariales sp. PMI_506]